MRRVPWVAIAGVLAWSQPSQSGPYHAWQARLTPRHCAVWTAPTVWDQTPLSIQECDGAFASR
jgi:hypothetical protein